MTWAFNTYADMLDVWDVEAADADIKNRAVRALPSPFIPIQLPTVRESPCIAIRERYKLVSLDVRDSLADEQPLRSSTSLSAELHPRHSTAVSEQPSVALVATSVSSGEGLKGLSLAVGDLSKTACMRFGKEIKAGLVLVREPTGRSANTMLKTGFVRR